MRREEIKRLERKRKLLNWFEAILYAIFIIYCIWIIETYKPVDSVGQVIEHKVKYYEHNLTQIANKYYPDVRLDKAIADIKKLNNMQESDIYVGQVLKLEVR